MEKFLNEIVNNLLTLKPLKVILFGSYAGDIDRNDTESDIDLIVILDIKTIPETYDHKLELKVQVRDSIYDLSRQKPIDLIVYTNGEFEYLKKQRSSFYNEIIETGKILYEKAS